MPEGDTIYRTATVLRSALLGRVVTAARARPGPGRARVPDLDRLVGQTVTGVESQGKHLLIRFSNHLTLRTHLRMRGSWHRYAPGEPWQRPAAQATVVLETPQAIAVCFSAPTAELLSDTELARQPVLRALGPDLLSADFDTDEAVRRLRELRGLEIGDALLEQRAVSGIGNVHKSEALFLERVNPFTPLAALADETLGAVLATARRLLAANVGGGRRVTTGLSRPGQGLWAYGRAGRPCRRCGALVRTARQGELARTTYWCPRCQPDAPRPGERRF
ncbi:MAG: DNA lyase [Chloroflexi bacterium]|nr:MAG: DNA lyase [Chloroflexota bacterium]